MKHLQSIFESANEKNSFSLKELYCVYNTSDDEIGKVFLKEDLAILECNKLNQEFNQKNKISDIKIYKVMNLDSAIDEIKDGISDYYNSQNEDY